MRFAISAVSAEVNVSPSAFNRIFDLMLSTPAGMAGLQHADGGAQRPE